MQSERPRRLSARTVDFGLAAMEFCATLPRPSAGRHIGEQLLRSATSVAANYCVHPLALGFVRGRAKVDRLERAKLDSFGRAKLDRLMVGKVVMDFGFD